MNYNKETEILLPKGTILHHYVTKKNKNRSNGWYYLAAQEYTTTINAGDGHKYIVKEDVILTKFAPFPEIMGKKSRHTVNEPGIYDGTDYMFNPRNDHGFHNRKNVSAKKHPEVPFVTFNNLYSSGDAPDKNCDLLRGQYILYKECNGCGQTSGEDDEPCGGCTDTFMYVVYEIVLPNDKVEHIGKLTKGEERLNIKKGKVYQ